MGLLLCGEYARHPFYYEKMDLNLWSCQELCYVIYHYPVIIPEDFVDRKLTSWLREEQGKDLLASKLEQYMSAGEDQERLLLGILREGNYYTQAEIARFEAEYNRLKSIDRDEFLELLGDTFFRMGRYGKAIEAYEMSLRMRQNATIKMKLGGAYVTVMQFQKASDIYEEVFVETNNREPLKRLYFIEKLDPCVDTIKKYLDTIDTENLAEWELQYDNVQAEVEKSERVERVNAIYRKDRQEFRQQAKLLLLKWKKEYRDKV